MKSYDLVRLERMLDSDKMLISEESRKAAIRDFRRVAEEYFETNGGFLLTTREGKRGTEVVFTFRIHRVKNFTSLK